MTSILKQYAKPCECGSVDLHIQIPPGYLPEDTTMYAVRCRSCGNVGEHAIDGELATIAWNGWCVLELFKRIEVLEKMHYNNPRYCSAQR